MLLTVSRQSAHKQQKQPNITWNQAGDMQYTQCNRRTQERIILYKDDQARVRGHAKSFSSVSEKMRSMLR